MRKVIASLLISFILGANLSCYAASLEDNIQVSLTQLVLNSKLQKSYSAYKYTIQNNNKEDLNLINAQIVNGVSGNIAYQAVENGHPIGTTWAICGPIGLVTLGMGWVAGIIATPVVWVVSTSNNKKAQTESNAYSNLVDLGYIKRGRILTVNTLVPLGTQPQLKLTFQNPKNKELINVYK